MKKIAVIGAGAAGMMAAYAAAESGAEVTLFEKNEKAGKKIYITGKGRCNVTNACDVNDYFANIIRNPKFMYSAIYDFDNQAVMDFFEQKGCKLKIERGERVFPVSDHSSDIIKAIFFAVKDAGVKVLFDTGIDNILYEADQVKSVVTTDGDVYEVDAVIVATGGLSYPTTGSTGDGYSFAKASGHKLVQSYPALVPLEIKEDWCKDLQGLSLRNVSVVLENIPDDKKAELKDEGPGKTKKKKVKKVYEGFGEMLFTHFGVSGPLMLTASSFYEPGTNMRIHLDLKPALTFEQLDKRIIRDFEAGLNKNFENAVSGLFPTKLIPVMVKLSGISADKKVNEITKEERQDFVKLIKDVQMTVTGTRGFKEAIITRGGVSVKDINPSTMESKHKKGLYFAGEVLDVDAVTGGFNLQVAWSTGHLAGVSAAGKEL